jgi:ATP-dependent DNA helicase RecG
MDNLLLYIWRVDLAELTDLVTDLRRGGSDHTGVEVKRAASGFPENLAPTVSAFANTPGGGILILGLAEAQGFASVGVYDATAAQKALASVCRDAVAPPVTFTAEEVLFEGATLLIADVDEQPSTGKPVQVRTTRKAYLRQFDGDYELSQVEEQAFIANRSEPRFDRRPVTGTSVQDLRDDLLASYLRRCRETSSALGGMADTEILWRTGVTTGDDRELSLAGLLAMGVYPQQHLPNVVVQASLRPNAGEDLRALDSRRFDGPLPVILDDVLTWVRRNSRTRLRVGQDGTVRDESEFPANAVRELVSNALIHRDLGPHALTTAVTLVIEPGQLVLSNPGGLWGITVDRLGRENVTSARNGTLLRICQNISTPQGNRVVEALATGIPTVLLALRQAGMAPPSFHDEALRFTARVPTHALLAAEDLEWLAELPSAPALTDSQSHALVTLRRGGEWTNQTYRHDFPMDSRQAHRELTRLVELGLADADGDRGQRTYRLSARLSATNTTRFPDAARRNPRATTAQAIATLLQEGPLTVAQMADALGLTRRQITYALDQLRNEGRVTADGGRGKLTVYRTGHPI